MPSDADTPKTVDRVNTKRKPHTSHGPRSPRLNSFEVVKRHVEEQALKKVLETGVKGTVKWFSVSKKYGFLARDDGKDDIFVYQLNITNSTIHKYYLRSLATEEKVVFDVVEGRNGPEAANVSGPNGKPVIGASFRYVYTITFGYPPNLRRFKNTESDSTPKNRSYKPKQRINRLKKERTTSVATDATQDTVSEREQPKDKPAKVEHAKSNAKPKRNAPKTPRKFNKKVVVAGGDAFKTAVDSKDVAGLVEAVGSIEIAN